MFALELKRDAVWRDALIWQQISVVDNEPNKSNNKCKATLYLLFYALLLFSYIFKLYSGYEMIWHN